MTSLPILSQEQVHQVIFIMNHHGFKNQTLQTCEELSELITALSKHKRKNTPESRNAVISEIADSCIMLAQLIEYFSAHLEIKQEIERKLNRECNRITAV